MLDLGAEPDADSYDAACVAALSGLGPDGWEIALLAVPVHRLCPGEAAGWNSRIPHIGWAFPVFTGDDLACLAFVGCGRSRLEAAPAGSPLDTAFWLAFGMADAASALPRRLRIVEGENIGTAFWLEGDGDVFVPFEDARVMHPSEFVSNLMDISAVGTIAGTNVGRYTTDGTDF